jgi:polyisoprenyl-teichoic acid--peptidoglycan teichoic acid transferase
VEYMEDEEIILLPSGSVSLDGAKAVLYGTYHDSEEAEVERVNRRQRMSQAFFSRIGEESALFTDATVNSMFKKRIVTNLGNRALLSYIETLRQFDADRAVFQRVLGTRRDVDGQILLFPHYEGSLVREAMDQTLLSIASEAVYSDEEMDISVEILNGTSRNGLAGRTSTIYKSFGYEIVGVGNTPEGRVEKTYIIAHSGDTARAQQVANVIQCKEIKSVEEANYTALHESGKVLDVTIVLGKDFDGRFCKSE